MKPVVIIAIAVVCSVVAVLGILVGWEIYEIYLYEKSIKFGKYVEKDYQFRLDSIVDCIPDKTYCFTQIKTDFRNSFNIVAKQFGFDPTNQEIISYRESVENMLHIEYNYQNNVYEIKRDYSNSYYDNYAHAPQLDNVGAQWQKKYQIAKANTLIEVGQKKVEYYFPSSYSICEEVFDRQLKDEPKAVSSSLICHRSLDEAITNYCQNTNMGWGNIESCKEDWTEKIKSFEQLRIDRTPDCEEKFYQEMKMSTTEYFTICIDQGIDIAVDEYCKDNNTGIGNILDCKSELVN